MPLYEYQCGTCDGRIERRRFFADREAPFLCECGGQMAPQFSPNGQIHIPIHFKSVRQGGAEGGYSWSDFHGDTTEKDLAHIKELNGRPVEIVKTEEYLSMAGTGHRTREQKRQAREKEIETGLTTAFAKARAAVGPAPPED